MQLANNPQHLLGQGRSNLGMAVISTAQAAAAQALPSLTASDSAAGVLPFGAARAVHKEKDAGVSRPLLAAGGMHDQRVEVDLRPRLVAQPAHGRDCALKGHGRQETQALQWSGQMVAHAIERQLASTH